MPPETIDDLDSASLHELSDCGHSNPEPLNYESGVQPTELTRIDNGALLHAASRLRRGLDRYTIQMKDAIH